MVTAAGLAVIAQGRGLDFVSPLELGAALAGFLVLNWHPARVFMGDAGTYFLGLYLTHLIIDSTNESAIELVFTAGVLGVFAIDMLVTLLRRRLNHRPLFLGDRSHIYDQLRDRGVGVRAIALIAAATQAVLLALVIAAEQAYWESNGVWCPSSPSSRYSLPPWPVSVSSESINLEPDDVVGWDQLETRPGVVNAILNDRRASAKSPFMSRRLAVPKARDASHIPTALRPALSKGPPRLED